MPEKDVVLLTGDGIGPEITAAVLDVLDASYPPKDAILISGGRPESSGYGL